MRPTRGLHRAYDSQMGRREILNALTHGIGAVLAVIGTSALLVLAIRDGDAWKVTSFAIYGAMLVLLYVASTLYHGVRERWKPLCRKLDHAAIYLLIAGTYTPFTLVTLRGAWGWSLFGAIWALAVLGIAQELALAGRRRVVSMILYLGMGWLAIVATGPLVLALPASAVAWMVGGGLLYTFGTIFYGLDRRWLYAHPVWHLFVLGGSACHFVAVLRYVA